ncbi:RNA polymerase sigma factor SigF, partial [Micromonospora sp. NPDC049282]
MARSVTEVHRAPQTGEENRAGELIAALAELPAGHPRRAALRNQVIEAWLPLANHLAARYS